MYKNVLDKDYFTKVLEVTGNSTRVDNMGRMNRLWAFKDPHAQALAKVAQS